MRKTGGEEETRSEKCYDWMEQRESRSCSHKTERQREIVCRVPARHTQHRKYMILAKVCKAHMMNWKSIQHFIEYLHLLAVFIFILLHIYNR